MMWVQGGGGGGTTRKKKAALTHPIEIGQLRKLAPGSTHKQAIG